MAPAVLFRGYLGTVDGRRTGLVEGERGSLPAIAAAAVELGAGVVFALDDGQALAGGDGWREPEVTGGDVTRGHPWRVHMRTEVDGIACGPRGRATRLGSTVAIVWPAHDSEQAAGPWQGFDARELLAAFGELERLLGVGWSHSLGATVQGLILATHPLGRGGRRLDEAPACPGPAAPATLEGPYIWRRELTKEEAAAGWVHVFDANAQYLAAWGSAELGAGVAQHRVKPRFDPGRAGVWRLEHVPAGPASLLPPPALAGREWFTTATVVRLLEVCEGFDAPMIEEAWVWPEKSRYLRGAAERLRDARASLRDRIAAARASEAASADLDVIRVAVRQRAICESALEAVGHLYKRGTQRFGMVRDGERISPWYRPDWGNTVRAVARCNLHRRLERLARAPFAVDVDALAFATDEPDPVAFAEQIRLPLGAGLGQFKYEGSREMAGDVAELPAGKLMRSVEA